MHWIGGAGSLEFTMVGQVDRDSDLAPTCSACWVGEGFSKEIMAPACRLYEGRAPKEKQRMVPTCWLCVWRAQQRTMVPIINLVLERAVSPVLVLKPDGSVLPLVSLVLFGLLPQHWSSE